MYVGVAWVHPCLIALEGEYKIDPYMVICMLLYKGQFYVCRCGLGTSLADCCIPSTAYGIHRNFALAWKSASHMKLGHIISHI